MKASYQPDPRPRARIKDSALMSGLHRRGVRCVLCGNRGSLHHVLPRSARGDDLYENLVGLCGDGTTGEHGLVEAGDPVTCEKLGAYLEAERPDTIFYILDRLGEEAGKEWLRRHLYLHIF